MLEILLKPCIFVYRIFKYAFKGLMYIFNLIFNPNHGSNENKKNTISENVNSNVKIIKERPEENLTTKQLEKRKKKAEKAKIKLERQQKYLEAQILKHEKKIEAEKIKEQKKLEEEKQKQQLKTEERQKREREHQQKIEAERIKKEEENKIREEREAELSKIKEQKNKEKREARLQRKIKRVEEQTRRKEIRDAKRQERNAQREEARKIKEAALSEKNGKREELNRIKEEQREIAKQNKIAEIREKALKDEEQSYDQVKTREEKRKLAKQKVLEKKEAKKQRKIEKQRERKALLKAKNKGNDDYINENVDIEKPNPFIAFSAKFKSLFAAPKKFIDKLNNNSFAKNKRNKNDINRQALLIDFEGEEAKKSDIKLVYEYEAKDKDGKFVRGTFEAYSRVEVHSFLLSEGYEVYSIKTNKWINLRYGRANVNNVKFKNKDLIFFLSQLSTYLRAGITLVEALKILSRQFAKTKKYKKIFESIIYELTMGESFSSALEKQNVAFPKILVNMVKTAEMTGELPEVLDDMVNYFSEIEETRRQFINAMMYPSIVFVFAIGVSAFILIYVVPQFTEIYSSMDGTEIPAFTQAVLSFSNFLKSKGLYVLIGMIIFVFVYIFVYKHNTLFRTINQWLFMHVPAIGPTMVYSEVATFTKTLSSLLAHNVPITESMEILNKITNNEIYKMLILDVVANLGKGGKISDAFEGHWAFPIPAYEMICTGEATGELPEMLGKVSSYYQALQKSSVVRIKTFVEPLITVFLTVIVGTIVLAIVIPMFNMYEAVQDY